MHTLKGLICFLFLSSLLYAQSGRETGQVSSALNPDKSEVWDDLTDIEYLEVPVPISFIRERAMENSVVVDILRFPPGQNNAILQGHVIVLLSQLREFLKNALHAHRVFDISLYREDGAGVLEFSMEKNNRSYQNLRYWMEVVEVSWILDGQEDKLMIMIERNQHSPEINVFHVWDLLLVDDTGQTHQGLTALYPDGDTDIIPPNYFRPLFHPNISQIEFFKSPEKFSPSWVN